MRIERLQQADLIIIERFLRNATDQNDMLALDELLQTNPQLQYPSPKDKDLDESAQQHFDADIAFMKLHERFKNENLL
jgi:hypothetical protein